MATQAKRSFQGGINSLRLANSRPDATARIAMVSMPVAPGIKPPTRLGRLRTQSQPIAWWPESEAGRPGVPRRQLMFALSGGALPRTLGVSTEPAAKGNFTGPEAACRIVSKKNTGCVLEEFNELELSFGGKTMGLRMGLRHAGQDIWWEWVRIEELWTGPLCKAIRVAGIIEVEHFGDDYFRDIKAPAEAKCHHYHNWLRGEIYALLFANGVVHLTVHHVNNHVFDHGRDLQDVLPLVGLRVPAAPEKDQVLDGSRTRFALGGVQLNLDEAATAFSPEHPGALRRTDDLLVFEPYDGVEILGDSHHRERPDGYICKVEDKVMPKGVARTLRFSLGLGEDEPVISRLVVPAWWYGAGGDLWPDKVLPVHDSWDRAVNSCQAYVKQQAAKQRRAFDNGILTSEVWEGETPFSQMLAYYIGGDPEIFDVALNDSTHIADIGFDHATETMRMHNYPFGAISPPLYRTVSMTFAYLETGDPYFLDCSESAASHYYWIDRHNWPRRSFGRDASSVRSLIFLWDYTGKEDYLKMARDTLGRLIACQLPDGSYADQGGAVGGCGGCANEIIKPWMAMMANDPVVDYLARRPNDPELRAALERTADFLLKTQIHADGDHTWAYEYRYGDNPGNGLEMMVDPVNFERHPTRKMVNGYKARFLMFASRLTGKTKYFEAWELFHAVNWAIPGKEPSHVGYTSNKVVQNVPYAQAHRWNASLTRSGAVCIEPMLTGVTSELESDIATPYGPMKARFSRNNGGFEVETQARKEFAVEVVLPGGKRARISSNTCRKIPGK